MVATMAKELAIGVLMFENVTTLDFVGPTSYLEFLPKIAKVPVRFHTIGNVQGRIQPPDLVSLYVQTHYRDAPEDLDLLVVPGGPGRTQVLQDKAFLAYIREAAERAPTVLSVCTGSYLLGATGVLDGKRATTNKMAFDKVAGDCPNVQWIRHARWVVDGKWWTSSGVSAGLDMGHAYVSATYGPDVAKEIARYLEHVPNTDPSNDPFAPKDVNASVPASS